MLRFSFWFSRSYLIIDVLVRNKIVGGVALIGVVVVRLVDAHVKIHDCEIVHVKLLLCCWR